jgi:hypothetical protein
MGFTEWIVEKYNEWSKNRSAGGRHKDSHAAYARWLGLNQQLVSSWILGKAIPDVRSKHNIDKLVARYGTEVYDILGIEYSDADVISALAYMVPEDKRPELIKLIRDWGSDHGYQLQVSPKSEDSREEE